MNGTNMHGAPFNGRSKILFPVWLFALLAYSHQYNFDSGIPASRLDLLRALVVRGSFSIDAYHHNTSDKAWYDGHYYSDKAPGTVAAALPAFAAAIRIVEVAKIPPDSRTAWLTSSWLACAGSIAAVAALGGVALFASLCRLVGARSACLTTLALFLGGPPLPYSTAMFSHALVIGLICIAIWALRVGLDQDIAGPQAYGTTRRQDRGRPSSPTNSPIQQSVNPAPRYALAGFCCGFALASEFSSGLIIAVLFLWLLLQRREAVSLAAEQSQIENRKSNNGVPRHLRRSLSRLGDPWRFAVGALPPLLLIPAYNWVCLGNAFVLPYTFQAAYPAMQRGLYAIEWPSPLVLVRLLFSPARGLLFWTPFLLLALVGWRAMYRRRPGVFWLTLVGPVLHVLVISGRAWDWAAGPVYGARLLSPALPLLAIPCAYGAQGRARLAAALAIYSIEVTTIATLTDASPPLAPYPNPLFDLQLPLLLKGDISPNLGLAFGLPPHASVALFYCILIAGVYWLWRTVPGLGRVGEAPDARSLELACKPRR